MINSYTKLFLANTSLIRKKKTYQIIGYYIENKEK